MSRFVFVEVKIVVTSDADGADPTTEIMHRDYDIGVDRTSMVHNLVRMVASTAVGHVERCAGSLGLAHDGGAS